MNLFKTTILSGILTAVRVLTGMVSIKVVAVFLGPQGVAYVGQFQSFLKIINNLANFGIGQGITKYIAQYRKEKQMLPKIVGTSTAITLVATCSVSFILFIWAGTWSQWLFKTYEYSTVFVWLSFLLVFFSMGQVLLSVLNGFKQIRPFIFARAVHTLLALAFTVVLVYLLRVKGALLALVFGQATVFIAAFIFARGKAWMQWKWFMDGVDKQMLRKLLAFSLMAFSSVILLELRQLYLRDYVIVRLSPEQAGYWQAMWKISEIYLLVLTTALSTYYLPRLSEIDNTHELRREIGKSYLFILPVVLVLSSSMFLFRDFVIRILFTPDFFPMRNLFLFQLTGDVFKISSWVLSFLLVAKAMTKTFLITEVVFKISFLGFALFFMRSHGVVGLTYAFALNYFVYFITMLLIFRNLLLNRKK